jgi:carboxyl-terminal processing protease
LTIQKFYRVNGGSTQLKGVTPDIILPDLYSEIEVGERKDKAALNYDEIKPAQFLPFEKAVDVAKLLPLSQQRVAANQAFAAVKENAKRLKKLEEENIVFLNQVKYKKEQEAAAALSKKIEDLDKNAQLLDIDNLQEDKARIAADTAMSDRNKTWLRLLKKDIFVSETVNILHDMRK